MQWPEIYRDKLQRHPSPHILNSRTIFFYLAPQMVIFVPMIPAPESFGMEALKARSRRTMEEYRVCRHQGTLYSPLEWAWGVYTLSFIHFTLIISQTITTFSWPIGQSLRSPKHARAPPDLFRCQPCVHQRCPKSFFYHSCHFEHRQHQYCGCL